MAWATRSRLAPLCLPGRRGAYAIPEQRILPEWGIGKLQKEQEQTRLTEAEQRLKAKVEAFRTQKEVIKAEYSAAEAQVRIGESLGGLSEEMADVGASVDRAQQKTEQMRARASAIDELTRVGVLEDFTGTDQVSGELARLTAAQNVEEELQALKQGLPAPAQPRQLGPGSP